MGEGNVDSFQMKRKRMNKRMKRNVDKEQREKMDEGKTESLQMKKKEKEKDE